MRQLLVTRPEGSPGKDALTSREKAVVEALAEGLTDAEVGLRLGVSPRTVAYSIRALMDRYQVDNRFQLGLVLGHVAVATFQQPPGHPADHSS